jgi:hypothetical protein
MHSIAMTYGIVRPHKKRKRKTYRRISASHPRCEEEPSFGLFNPALSLEQSLSLRLSELAELARALNDLSLHCKAHARRYWICQTRHVHGHQADSDPLDVCAFEWVIVDTGRCLSGRLRRSEWAINALRGEERITFVARAARCRRDFNCDRKSDGLGL